MKSFPPFFSLLVVFAYFSSLAVFTVSCHIISNLATICGCEDPDTDSLILFQFISRHYLSCFLFSSLLELYVALFSPIISYHLNESKLLHATDKTLNKCWVEVSVSPCMSFPLFDFYPSRLCVSLSCSWFNTRLMKMTTLVPETNTRTTKTNSATKVKKIIYPIIRSAKYN